MLSEARIKANKKYQSKLKSVALKFRPEQDAIILEKLASMENKTDYVRQLILKDIAENSK